MRNINILLVEDNEVNQIVASALLKQWGLTVTIANDGKKALALVQNKNFHLILMDLQMPEMDGYESTNHIRAFDDPYFKNVPIIAFSASSMINTKELAVSYGMTDFIHKPLCVEELQEKINHYVVASDNPHPQQDVVSINIDQHTDGDPAFKSELLCLIKENINELKQSLQHTLSVNEPQGFLKTCHKIAASLEILNNYEFTKIIESLKAHYKDNTDINIDEKAKLFYSFCDRIITALRDEVVKCEDSSKTPR
jgi:CheY-like chemotaxis protein